MKASSAIAKFLNQPGFNPNMTYTKATITEIKTFKDSCSPEEYKEFGRQACALLGEEFEE